MPEHTGTTRHSNEVLDEMEEVSAPTGKLLMVAILSFVFFLANLLGWTILLHI